jgi:hypothetical protein
VQSVTQFLQTLNDIKKQQYESELMKQYAEQVSEKSKTEHHAEILKLLEAGDEVGALEKALGPIKTPEIMQQRQTPQQGGVLSRILGGLNPLGEYRGPGLTPTEATIIDARQGETARQLSMLKTMQSLLAKQKPQKETEAELKRRYALAALPELLQSENPSFTDKKGNVYTIEDPKDIIEAAKSLGLTGNEPEVRELARKAKFISEKRTGFLGFDWTAKDIPRIKIPDETSRFEKAREILEKQGFDSSDASVNLFLKKNPEFK